MRCVNNYGKWAGNSGSGSQSGKIFVLSRCKILSAMSKSRKPTPTVANPRSNRPSGSAKTAATSTSPRTNASPATWSLPDFFTDLRLQSWLIFGFAFLLYANTLMHGFVLDDSIVITDNMFTKQGVQGIPGIFSKDTFYGFFKVEGKDALVSGGRYRPMTLALFAIVYQIFGGESPFVYHLLTVLLFALTCVVLYHVLLRLFANQGTTTATLLAWMATLLFTAHPIHTEVVNNIKGCDEIVTLLGCLTALWCTFKAIDTGRSVWKLGAGISFFLACLSKENAAAFVLLIPLALWFSEARGSSAETSKKPSVVAASWPIWAAFAVFFVLRGSILHWKFGADAEDLMNNPFLKFEGGKWVPFQSAEKLASIFYTLGKYILLLFVPHPLTHDYYPRVIGMVRFANPMVLFSLAAYGYLAYQAVLGLRDRNPAQLGVWMYLLPLGIVSNILFPIGTNMGERFAFMPSVGFCIAVAALLSRWTNAGNLKTMLYVLGAVLALFSLKTVVRNTAWSSNENLFFTDVGTSDNSAKIHNACGGILFDRANQEKDPEKRLDLCRQSVVHLTKALEIYPNYKDAFISRGGANYYLKNYDAAIDDYRQAVLYGPDDPRWKTYLAMSLRDGGQYYGEQKHDLATAQRYLAESWQLNEQDAQTARLLGVANGVQAKHPEAIAWFRKAVELDPKNASFLFDLGTAYYASGDAANGALYRQQAATLDPTMLEKK